MLHGTLNLGILAHVDAGKTTLTERLLHAAGVIRTLGRVDDGTTQTDSLALERRRGITIKSAVVSFAIDDVTVNLIDTPGHPDFIAEVERVLSVLDGAVLVLSAVEGVQAQTLLLMRALQRLRVPTLLFINKIDRSGADSERVLRAIAERLTPAAVPLGSVAEPGTRQARFVPSDVTDAEFAASLVTALADHDDAILAGYVEDGAVPFARLREALVAQTADAVVHPVFFGSAITGAGVEELMGGIAELLPAATGDVDGPASGTVFKVERGTAGEKIAYVRMFSGTLRTRDRLDIDGRDQKVTAIGVFDRGGAVPRAWVEAGEIGKLWGLADVRIGDAIGEARRGGTEHHFAPPSLETVVLPRNSADRGRVLAALTQLAEQDPLIDVRRDDARQELSVSLYGEVQKEVIEATLADEYGLQVGFRETTMICVERPSGTGHAIELLHADTNPYLATIGLRIAPGPHGSGLEFAAEVDHSSIPLYLYKTRESFVEHMQQYVLDALREGLYGWRVTDCIVTLSECVYSIPDGPPSRRGPPSTAADFRKLTPLVLEPALARAGTTVCEPVHRFRLELPPSAIGTVLPVLTRLRALPETPAVAGRVCVIEGTVPAESIHRLRIQIPGLTQGEGVLESAFDSYRPVVGPPPTRRRVGRDTPHSGVVAGGVQRS